ncbi:MAG: hypothetical protein M3Y85_09115 [Bacteroidota bacterium]|nr:hypothetical protein [Bacteroidota bacterium]
MKKFLVIAKFQWSEEMMQLVPEHRQLINALIEQLVIDHYAVSMELQTVWITMNAKNKTEIKKLLLPSPLVKHWKMQVSELMVWDGQNYRLPALQLN